MLCEWGCYSERSVGESKHKPKGPHLNLNQGERNTKEAKMNRSHLGQPRAHRSYLASTLC